MNRIVYHIDEKGFIIDSYVGKFNENGDIITEFPHMNIVIEPLPQPLPFYKPKWTVSEWIEGETEAERLEREAIQQLESLLPSPNEIADAELEIKIITLLTELEVVLK